MTKLGWHTKIEQSAYSSALFDFSGRDFSQKLKTFKRNDANKGAYIRQGMLFAESMSNAICEDLKLIHPNARILIEPEFATIELTGGKKIHYKRRMDLLLVCEKFAHIIEFKRTIDYGENRQQTLLYASVLEKSNLCANKPIKIHVIGKFPSIDKRFLDRHSNYQSIMDFLLKMENFPGKLQFSIIAA